MTINRKRGSTRKRRANKRRANKSRGGASASGGSASASGDSKRTNVYEQFIILKNWINSNRVFFKNDELGVFDSQFKIVENVERYLKKYKYDFESDNSKVYTGMCYDTFRYMLLLFNLIVGRNPKMFQDPAVARIKGDEILSILKNRYNNAT